MTTETSILTQKARYQVKTMRRDEKVTFFIYCESMHEALIEAQNQHKILNHQEFTHRIFVQHHLPEFKRWADWFELTNFDFQLKPVKK